MALRPKRISLMFLGLAAVVLFHAFAPEEKTEDASLQEKEIAQATREVSGVAKEKKAEAQTAKQEYEAKLTSEGWKPVSTDEPDNDVIELSLDALRSKPEKVKMHLLSNSFSGENLEKIRDIALETRDQELRFIAIEALGKSTDPAAQSALIDCFEKMDEGEVKNQILSYMHPKDLDDTSARFLFNVIGDSHSTDAMKRQAAFPLVVASAVQAGGSHATEVLSRTPESYRERMSTIIQQLLEARQ